jgi:hypothetical protein
MKIIIVASLLFLMILSGCGLAQSTKTVTVTPPTVTTTMIPTPPTTISTPSPNFEGMSVVTEGQSVENVTAHPIFVWKKLLGPTPTFEIVYDIEIAIDSDYKFLVDTRYNLKDGNYTYISPFTFKSKTNYYWRIRAATIDRRATSDWHFGSFMTQ